MINESLEETTINNNISNEQSRKLKNLEVKINYLKKQTNKKK